MGVQTGIRDMQWEGTRATAKHRVQRGRTLRRVTSVISVVSVVSDACWWKHHCHDHANDAHRAEHHHEAGKKIKSCASYHTVIHMDRNIKCGY